MTSAARIRPDELSPLRGDDAQRLENVLSDTALASSTRRQLLKRASATAAAVAATGAGQARAASIEDTPTTVLNTAVTAEGMAVTLLSELLRRPHATGISKFVEILKAANSAEYDHYKTLTKLGAKPLTEKFWIPAEFLDPAHVFPTLEIAETVFVNAYLIGATVFAKASSATNARYAAEIAGVEAQHRVLVRFAQNKLPNDVGFESYELRSMSAIVAALKRTGLGFGSQGSKPGRYHTFAPPPRNDLLHLSPDIPS